MLADPTESFPPDAKVHHFDNNAAALVTSDYLMESYLKAAHLLVEKASNFGEPPAPQKWVFQAPFCQLPARPDGQDVAGKFQNIRKNHTYEDGYLWLSEFAAGVPHDGYYRLRFKAQAAHRNYPYEESRVGVRKSEPLRVGIVAGNPEYGDLKAANGSDRPLDEIDLPDAEPQWFERKIWLDRGYQPRFCFPNGPNRTKPLRGYTVTTKPEMFPDFIRKFVAAEDNEFRDLEDQYRIRKDNYKERGKKGKGKLNSNAFYSDKNSKEGWLTWTREYLGPRVRIYEVQLEGPFYDEWPGKGHQTLYRGKAPVLENAPAIFGGFATEAFRRPVKEKEVEVFVDLAESVHHSGKSEQEAIQTGLQAILCSPGFLWFDPGDSELGTSAYTLAGRLSYFLWGTAPDAQLLKSAADGSLQTSDGIAKEAGRMLKGPRSDSFVKHFSEKWLQLDKVGTQLPSHTTFPRYFTHQLEAAMKKETELFVRHVLSENLLVKTFLDSDFAFVNSNLAHHYGIEGVSGHEFQKVALTNRTRGGLLGQASILTASANGIDTSPVIRGIWVLENLFGTPPSPPPPDVEPIEPDIRGVKTIREQLLKHREVETCAECHRKIDPPGFALENFDPIGGWRDRYVQTKARPKVDASGELSDGSEFKGIVQFKDILLKKEEMFIRNLTGKLLAYASGRDMGPADRPEVDSIVEKLEESGGGFRDLVILITKSPIFLE